MVCKVSQKGIEFNLRLRKKVVKVGLLFLTFIVCLTMRGHAQKPSRSDFPIRGFYLDFRTQVMTPAALQNFAKELAGFGLNTIIVEWSASYPFDNNATIPGRYAYTTTEIRSFIHYCSTLGISVIPSQQCFGHVQYILRHNRYAGLRVNPHEISQVCACDIKEDSLLFSNLFYDLAKMFPSRYIFINGDETRFLGQCKECKEKLAEYGKGKVYADYIRLMCNIVLSLGKIPIMWDDMLLKFPKYASEIPKQTIIVDWNYGWGTEYLTIVKKLQRQGFTFWGAPAIRSGPDDWYVTSWEMHFNNQRRFIPFCREAGYKGIIMTSWSTSGLYNVEWGQGNEVLGMRQIRNNFPLSGFRILIASYVQALKQNTPLVPKEFVIQYAQKRFGFSRDGGASLWKALISPQYLIRGGQPEGGLSIRELLDTNLVAQRSLNKLEPIKNKKEFAYFRLMFRLRGYYLKYKSIESIYNSQNFNKSELPDLINKIKSLKIEEKKNDAIFYNLNKKFLYSGEISAQNAIRDRPLNKLYLTLIRDKGQ